MAEELEEAIKLGEKLFGSTDQEEVDYGDEEAPGGEEDPIEEGKEGAIVRDARWRMINEDVKKLTTQETGKEGVITRNARWNMIAEDVKGLTIQER